MKTENQIMNEILKNKSRKFYNQYGRCINLSIGLLIGIGIDKFLLYITKGFSFFIPPFAVMLMNKGIVLKTIRFDREFSKPVELILSHFVKQ